MGRNLSECDQELVQLMLQQDGCSIAELSGRLGVTATAVRQRLSRLHAAGLIDRCVESTGRGRPTHRYALTGAGRKLAGNNLSDFAGALWWEIQQIPDESVRRSILSGVVRRMADDYADRIDGSTPEARLASIAELFGDRDIPVVVEVHDGSPTLKILNCPYPDLATADHQVCEMEKQLLSEMVGGHVKLCQCRQDGDKCCSFQAPASQ